MREGYAAPTEHTEVGVAILDLDDATAGIFDNLIVTLCSHWLPGPALSGRQASAGVSRRPGDVVEKTKEMSAMACVEAKPANGIRPESAQPSSIASGEWGLGGVNCPVSTCFACPPFALGR